MPERLVERRWAYDEVAREDSGEVAGSCSREAFCGGSEEEGPVWPRALGEGPLIDVDVDAGVRGSRNTMLGDCWT